MSAVSPETTAKRKAEYDRKVEERARNRLAKAAMDQATQDVDKEQSVEILRSPELIWRKDPEYHDVEDPARFEIPKVIIDQHNRAAIEAAKRAIAELQTFVDKNTGESDA